MTSFFIYFFEVTVCSALFTGYYWLVLRNGNYYRWNRLFINASVVLSLIIPLLNISIPSSPIVLQDTYDNVVNYIAVGNNIVTTVPAQTETSSFSWVDICLMAYLLVTFILLLKELFSFVRIVRLKRHAERVYTNEAVLYCINDNTAPFTFFRTIFWKKGISTDSGEGLCMLRHELAHVCLGHSRDKALMQLICCIFWMNPFFILLRRELELVHEFEADHESLGEGNAEELSSLILSTMYPNHYHDFTSRFYQSSIKRRIFMITKSQKTKLSIIRKISVIPVLIITLFAFSVSSGEPVVSLSSNVMTEDITQDVYTEESIAFHNPDAIVEDVTQDANMEKYEIQDIKVTGAWNYDDFVLIGFSGLKVGNVISVPGDEITEAINRFGQQGLFSEVKIVASRIEEDKVWLDIQLKPRPRIAEVNYNGIMNSEREELEIKIGLRKGYQITPHIVDRLKILVKEYFDDKGYKNVDVDVIEKPDPNNERESIVNINIDKKEKS